MYVVGLTLVAMDAATPGNVSKHSPICFASAMLKTLSPAQELEWPNDQEDAHVNWTMAFTVCMYIHIYIYIYTYICIYVYITLSHSTAAISFERCVCVCVCVCCEKLTSLAQKSRFSHPWEWEMLDSQMFSASDTQTPWRCLVYVCLMVVPSPVHLRLPSRDHRF